MEKFNLREDQADIYIEAFGMTARQWYEEGNTQLKSHDPINHPKHYTSHPSGIECIQVTRHMTFNLGNAVKYLWRQDHKDNPIQDLKKAIWYIQDEIDRLEKLNKNPNS